MAWDFLFYPLTASAAFVSGLVIIYYTYPVLLVKAGLRYLLYVSGMTPKFIGDEKFIFCYGEKGTRQKNKSSVLFIHGYTASKDQWLTVVKKFPAGTHIIAVDLPGHGNSSTPNEDSDVSFPYTIALLHKFVQLVGLDEQPFHIVGTSLGGLISGLYAAEHPECIERVTMVCPAMKTPVDSEFSRQMEYAITLGPENLDASHCSLIPQTTADTLKMLDSCRYHKNPINPQILKGIVAMRTPKNQFFLRLFKNLVREENKHILADNASKITSPAQLIWGEHDQLIDKSGAKVLGEVLPQCERVDIIDRCGHSVCMDRPGALVKYLLEFRGETDKKQN